VPASLAASSAFIVVPVAEAAPVNLGTAAPFVVLGGSTVTNTGPSVLNGDLGVSPGTSLPGFNAAVVNGTIHANDAVAAQAQADLTTAYNVAAGQPVPPGNDLTGIDLGNKVLAPGNYGFSSSAQLTGQLILDAGGVPDAQFVFKIGSTLTTASASSVVLRNGASPCNVYWQVGSSATLGTTTAFQGNLMALTSITVNNRASVVGRVLARNGQISLDNNVLSNSACTSGSTPPGVTPPTSGGPTAPAAGAPGAPGSSAPAPGGAAPTGGPASGVPAVTRNGTAILRRGPRASCADGFRVTILGTLLKRVVFSLDGKRIATRVGSPFEVYVKGTPGPHKVRARVSFKDATRAKTLTLDYRACAAAALRPRRGPSQFTG